MLGNASANTPTKQAPPDNKKAASLSMEMLTTCPKCLPSCEIMASDSAGRVDDFRTFPKPCACNGLQDLGEVHDAAYCCTPYVAPHSRSHPRAIHPPLIHLPLVGH